MINMRGNDRVFTFGIFLAASCLMCAPADALIIDVTSTNAQASAGTVSNAGPLSADASFSDGTVTLAAAASLASGHLGASAVNSSTGMTGLAQAFTNLVLNISDVSVGDFIQLQTTLSGSFAPVLGDGGTVSLYVQKNSEPIQTSGISCSYYNAVYNGAGCRGQIYGQPVQNDVTQLTFDIPLIGLDSLGLEWILQVGAGPFGSASFLNSADFSITVPDGTVINGNPGGTLFQIPGSSGSGSGTGPVSVPEPNSVSLLTLGLICLGMLRKRKSGQALAW